jgi:phosphoserine aminotransferase
MLGEVLKWVEAQGGLEKVAQNNEEKAALIYDVIDASNGFYYGHADEGSRSLMNITFRVADENGLLLLDIKDLRAMLQYVSENAKELSQYYGNITKH